MPARSYAVITQSYAVVVTHCPISVFRFPFCDKSQQCLLGIKSLMHSHA